MAMTCANTDLDAAISLPDGRHRANGPAGLTSAVAAATSHPPRSSPAASLKACRGSRRLTPENAALLEQYARLPRALAVDNKRVITRCITRPDVGARRYHPGHAR